MTKHDLKNLIAYSEKGIVSKVIIKSEKINVSLFCMAKGTDISEHTSTREGTVYVIEGEGIFNLKKDSILMKEGILIHMKANEPHSIVAKQNTSFLLTIIN
jgi:nitric oxide dioxygenase